MQPRIANTKNLCHQLNGNPPDSGPGLKDPPKILSCKGRWQSACCKRVTSPSSPRHITHSSRWRFCHAIVRPDRLTIVATPHRVYIAGSHVVLPLKWFSMTTWKISLRIICMVVAIIGDMTCRMATLSERRGMK